MSKLNSYNVGYKIAHKPNKLFIWFFANTFIMRTEHSILFHTQYLHTANHFLKIITNRSIDYSVGKGASHLERDNSVRES